GSCCLTSTNFRGDGGVVTSGSVDAASTKNTVVVMFRAVGPPVSDGRTVDTPVYTGCCTSRETCYCLPIEPQGSGSAGAGRSTGTPAGPSRERGSHRGITGQRESKALRVLPTTVLCGRAPTRPRVQGRAPTGLGIASPLPVLTGACSHQGESTLTIVSARHDPACNPVHSRGRATATHHQTERSPHDRQPADHQHRQHRHRCGRTPVRHQDRQGRLPVVV